MIRLVVRLTPRASEDRIDGWARDQEGRSFLRARTTAAPTDGRANEALERLIARALDLPPSAVALVRGGSSRLKTLQIEGAEPELLRQRLGAPS